MTKFLALLFKTFLTVCATCSNVTFLKPIPINVPKGVEVISGQHNVALLVLQDRIRVVVAGCPSIGYWKGNLFVSVFDAKKDAKLSFESNEFIELDVTTRKQTNKFVIDNFFPYQDEAYQLIITKDSLLESAPKIIQFPNLIINGKSYSLPQIKVMKVTEELCFHRVLM